MSEFPSEVYAQSIQCEGSVEIGKLNNIKMAEDKFQSVKDAYDRIRTQKGF